MKVAIVVSGTDGDIYPMLSLASFITQAGHSVRVIGPPDFVDTAAQRGIEYLSMGESIRHFLTENAAAFHSRGLPFVIAGDRWTQSGLHSQFETLPDATADCDRIFAAGTVLAAASMAELHNIPYRYIAYTPALFPSSHHGPILFPVQQSYPWLNRSLWWTLKQLMALTTGRQIDRRRKSLKLPPSGNLTNHLLSEHPILAADSPLVSAPDDGIFDVQQIRCLHPQEKSPLPATLEAFLVSGPAPIYFGFGSMTDPEAGKTTKALVEVVKKLGIRALILQGWAKLGNMPLPAEIMAIGATPHASLFPRCRLVVHHGGAGTTHAAARAGVPQLIVPHILDQFYFARKTMELGISTATIPRSRLNASSLSKALTKCLADDQCIIKAQALANEIGELGPIAPDIERLLDSSL